MSIRWFQWRELFNGSDYYKKSLTLNFVAFLTDDRSLVHWFESRQLQSSTGHQSYNRETRGSEVQLRRPINCHESNLNTKKLEPIDWPPNNPTPRFLVLIRCRSLFPSSTTVPYFTHSKWLCCCSSATRPKRAKVLWSHLKWALEMQYGINCEFLLVAIRDHFIGSLTM